MKWTRQLILPYFTWFELVKTGLNWFKLVTGLNRFQLVLSGSTTMSDLTCWLCLDLTFTFICSMDNAWGVIRCILDIIMQQKVNPNVNDLFNFKQKCSK